MSAPDVAQRLCDRAAELLRDGLSEPAMPLLTRAAAIAPDWAPALSQLAHAHALAGRWEEAAAFDRAALELTSKATHALSPLPIQIPSSRYERHALEDSLPIVIVHRDLGMQIAGLNHLPYAVVEARLSNPRSPIVVIGDGSNRYPFVDHHLILDHYERASAFAARYRHTAFPVRYDFMLFSFQRFYVLLDFMESTGVDACLHIDPDALLYCDVGAVNVPDDCDFALSARPTFAVSPHYCFIRRRASLEHYCEFTAEMYDRVASRSVARSSMRRLILAGRPAYVTDMLAFEEFGAAGVGRIHDLSTVTNGCVWDANVASGDGFAMRDGVKDIVWSGERPYCRELRSGRDIRFHALHFNHEAKALIPNAFDRRPLVQRTHCP